jgi:ribonuclease HI
MLLFSVCYHDKMPVRKTAPAATGQLFAEQPSASPARRIVAHIDGGARGNPGPAAYGVLLEDETGQVIARLNRYLGRQTNNFAEYSGLIAALEFTLQHGFRALQVLSDSELLVRQIKGIYKVRNPGLQALYQRARTLIHQLDWFRVAHIRREQNREADRLANLAMDRKDAPAERA